MIDTLFKLFIRLLGIVLIVALVAMVWTAIDGIGFMRGWWK